MRNHWRKRRVFRRLVLGLAVAAVSVPSAQAQLHEREATEAGYGYVRSSAGYPAPRDWPGVNPNAAPNEARPRSGPLHVPGPRHVDPSNQVASNPDGFDWGDAGIGAGTLFAVVLLAAGGVLVIRHLNRAATA
jgi:hypothetical protein